MTADQIRDAITCCPQAGPDGLRWKKRRVLRALRETYDMEVAFISRFTASERVFDEIDTIPEMALPGLRAGAAGPRGQSYCERVRRGDLPNVLHDATAEPGVRDIAETLALPVGAHISVPIELSDGRCFGMLCAFSRRPDPTLSRRDHAMFSLCAELLAHDIEAAQAAQGAAEPGRSALSAVLGGGHYSFVAQPIFELTRREVVGYELLTRFPAALGTTEEVFQRAKYLDLSVSLEETVLRASRKIVTQVPAGAFLAVNLSVTVFEDLDLGRLIPKALRKRLVLELTEHEKVSDYIRLSRLVERAQGLGIRVAIDDVGAGFASFRHVLQLKPDILKIDRSFVDGVATSAAKASFIRAIRDYALATETGVIAEGIETAEELAQIIALGIPWGQGYHLGRPAPLGEALALAG